MSLRDDATILEVLKKQKSFFIDVEELLQNLYRSKNTYPPYNIVQLSSRKLCITFAVAGFHIHELEVYTENYYLVVRGNKIQEDTSASYLYRGIATRSFQQFFLLYPNTIVTSACLSEGLLNVMVEKIQETTEKVYIAIEKK